MDKKAELEERRRKVKITDTLNDALNSLMFDGTITSDERAEFSRRLGILFDLHDLLTYHDLREIALKALRGEPIHEETASDTEPILPSRLPAERSSEDDHLELNPEALGEEDAQGVDTSEQTWSFSTGELPEKGGGGTST